MTKEHAEEKYPNFMKSPMSGCELIRNLAARLIQQKSAPQLTEGLLLAAELLEEHVYQCGLVAESMDAFGAQGAEDVRSLLIEVRQLNKCGELFTAVGELPFGSMSQGASAMP